MSFRLALFFMIWVFWRPQEWLFPWLWGYDILDGVVFASCLAFLMEVDSGDIKIPHKWFILMLIGLFFATLMSHVANTYFGGLMFTWPITFKLVFYTILLYAVLDRPSRLRAVILIFVFMGCFMAYHAYLQQERGFGFMRQHPLRVYEGGKGWFNRSMFFGIFADPNDLAQYVVVCVPLCFAVFKRMNFLKFIICCVPCWYLYQTIGWTHSRGGLVGLVAAAGCTVLLFLPNRWGPYAMSLAVSVGLALCPFAGFALNPSARDRVIFWGLANWRFKHDPIFGIGYGMFGTIARDMAAHNAFVHCYTEIGLVGYWFWFGLMALGIIGCWRTRNALRVVRQRTKNNIDVNYLYRVSGLCVAAMVGYAASGYFLSRAFIYVYFFLVALLNAFPAIVKHHYPGLPEVIHPKKDIGLWVTIASMGSVVYIYWTIILLNKAFGY